MGLHRRAAKRDDNEPEIRKAFARHGWHTETMSAPGMPDLLAMKAVRHFGNLRPTPTIVLVDVKSVDGAPTEPQREKWKALSEKGIPVYVCRTEADVDALVRGELEPWRPEVTRKGMGHAVEPLMREGSSIKARARSGYLPPRSKPVDAAKEAAETFAPGEAQPECAIHDCREHPAYGSEFCAEHTP